MDPKKAAKMKALQQLQAAGGGKAGDEAAMGATPVRTPAVILHPGAVDTGGITGELEEPEAAGGGKGSFIPPQVSADASGVVDWAKHLGGMAAGGLKDLAGAVGDIPEGMVNAKRLMGGKPKMTAVKPPKAVSVSENEVTVVPDSQGLDLTKRKKRSFWHSNEET